MSYAQGKKAYGFCDRCSFRFKLSHLYEEIEDGRPNGLKVCRVCLDEDHPQLRLGETPVDEFQSLRDPRPDTGQAESQRLFSFDPAGENLFPLQSGIGVVKVVIE